MEASARLAVKADSLVLFCTTEDQRTTTLGLGTACTKGEQPKSADFGMAEVCWSGLGREIVSTVVQGKSPAPLQSVPVSVGTAHHFFPNARARDRIAEQLTLGTTIKQSGLDNEK